MFLLFNMAIVDPSTVGVVVLFSYSFFRNCAFHLG
jgi:hypothetical protein